MGLSKKDFVSKFQHHYRGFIFHRNQLNGVIGGVGAELTSEEIEIFRVAVRNMKNQFQCIDEFLAEYDTVNKTQRPSCEPR